MLPSDESTDVTWGDPGHPGWPGILEVLRELYPDGRRVRSGSQFMLSCMDPECRAWVFAASGAPMTHYHLDPNQDVS